jgi:hypothetical protein
MAANVLRSDTAIAFYDTPAGSGNTVASMLLASYKITPELAPMIRVGMVHSAPPAGENATHGLNPVLGLTYAPKIGTNFKLGVFLGVALPIGGGGGDPASPPHAAANGAGIQARSSMDNAMFAANYFTVFPGIGLAYTAKGFTVQGEATLLQLTQARGPEAEDDARTNLTLGVHVGYFVLPVLSFGAELRHQRWLSTPTPVKANSAARDTSTVAFGPRFHVPLSESVWLRPGVALVLPLDDPMKTTDHKIIQIDVPVAF